MEMERCSNRNCKIDIKSSFYPTCKSDWLEGSHTATFLRITLLSDVMGEMEEFWNRIWNPLERRLQMSYVCWSRKSSFRPKLAISAERGGFGRISRFCNLCKKLSAETERVFGRNFRQKYHRNDIRSHTILLEFHWNQTCGLFRSGVDPWSIGQPTE